LRHYEPAQKRKGNGTGLQKKKAHEKPEASGDGTEGSAPEEIEKVR